MGQCILLLRRLYTGTVITSIINFLDLMYGGPEQYNGTDRNLSITFNINHGVQIMRPPPYSNR